MFEIIPSPGTSDKEWSTIEKKINLVRPFAKTIHIDVIDGKFVDNTTFADPAPFAEYIKNLSGGEKDPFTGAGEFKFEVHLMVENPIQYIKPWADAGFKRFIGQVEKMPDQAEFVAEAQLWGEVGLAIDKQTPVEEIKVSYEDLDTVLVMMIQAGFSGQKFEEALVEKVKKLAGLTTIPIEVDGGINDETILIAQAQGATRFVASNFIYGLETPKGQYAILEKLLKMSHSV